ncbi:MAG: hypothetical protein HYU37_16325 [Acidobacteria bacterium]|nr:hypothetical protein [Acidobacteriota bacterium]
MTKYYVTRNAQLNGDHEVHHEFCAWLPLAQHLQYLGFFADCASAVREARKHFSQSNGCAFCASECHTR